eukprot:Em0007g43a
MGNAIGDARKVVQAAQEGKEASEERLKLLEKMVTNHLTLQKQHILNGERNDQKIHEGTTVREYQQMYVTDSRELSNEIEKTVDSLFSGDFLGALKKAATVALNEICGNTNIGEYEQSEMFIVWQNHALLRLDTYVYRWNFSSKGVITEAEGVLGVLMVQRVMNIAKVDPQVITWAICSGSSDEVAIKKEIDVTKSVLNSVVDLTKKMLMSEISDPEPMEAANK